MGCQAHYRLAMGKRFNSRTKGAAGERECFKLLNAAIGRDVFKRNLSQTRSGGCDSDGPKMIAMEVKRHEALQLRAAIEQAVAQALHGQYPVLAYRGNKEPWRFLVICDVKDMANLYELIEGSH